ncbi:unnamed protein product [Adineta steineri]|uniref:Uncharacterized protein n=1 Tax=Adineta steineri TaxID=433720 RepID=A0A819J7Y8_9BILA|nr:unnamed protein product [Adineta steineri]CAF3926261.1 unnamed protein product [Adineta steineri]
MPLNSTTIDQQCASINFITTNDVTYVNSVEIKMIDESSTCNLGLPLVEFPHSTIRTKVADVYVTRATRQQVAHKVHLQLLQDKCNVSDFVGLKTNRRDRTNTNPKLLLSMII